MSDLHQPHFQDPDKAREYLEAQVWPHGPCCPHCGSLERNVKIEGESARPGLYFCGDCRKQFTVTVGTVFESSKIPLHKWLLAVHLMCSSKKGISTHQIHRMLGITYKSAWFMTHRIREAFKMKHNAPLGGSGKTVEADETFYGRKRERKVAHGSGHKHKIFALVERNGDVRSFHVPNVTSETLKPILMKHAAGDSTLYTDSAGQYRKIKTEFPKHDTVNHMVGEYVRGDVHVQTAESFFGLLKRGLVGTFHHVSEAHLQRYCTEFDFRFSHRKTTDTERSNSALKGIIGKRLKYRRVSSQA
jgi:transposase-like protein